MAREKSRNQHDLHRVYTGKPAGTPPGTLDITPSGTPSTVRLFCYDAQRLTELDVTDVVSIAQHRRDGAVTWVNVDGLGDVGTLEAIGRMFDIHPLALEDIVNPFNRAKEEMYDRNLFIVARMPRSGGSFDTEQVSFVLGEGYLVTFQQEAGDCFDPVRQRIRDGRPRIRGSGADYLAYALLDAMVDSYFPILERYAEELEAIEDEIASGYSTTILRRIHAVKRDIVATRRAIWPQRDLIGEILREEEGFFRDATKVFLRDAHDHAMRIMDLVETYRELAAGLTDYYMSTVSNRMNEVMRVLTVIATIFIPLTFVAGIYGMNFNSDISAWNMPELHWALGYPTALLVMGAIAVGMVMFFRRKGWLGGTGPRGDEP